MIDVAAELERICEFATTLNRLPGVSRHNPDAWFMAREEVARGIARSVGRIRKELGVAEPPRVFSSRQVDAGHTAIRHNGRSIPVERR